MIKVVKQARRLELQLTLSIYLRLNLLYYKNNKYAADEI